MAILTIREEIKHGLFLGSEIFIEKVKTTFLTDSPQPDMPQQRHIVKNNDLEGFVRNAAEKLNCSLKDFAFCRRIKQFDKDNRDLLLYLVWDMELYSNKEIGELFGLTYSAVSRRAQIIQERLNSERKLQRRFEKIKSVIVEMVDDQPL